MKKLCLLFIVLLSLSLTFVGVSATRLVHAVDVLPCDSAATSRPTYCCDKTQNRPAYCDPNTAPPADPLFGPQGILTKVVQALSILIAGFAVFVIMIAGIRIVVSNGDPNTISTMRQAIIAAIVGLVIAGSAQLIVTFILSKV